MKTTKVLTSKKLANREWVSKCTDEVDGGTGIISLGLRAAGIEVLMRFICYAC